MPEVKNQLDKDGAIQRFEFVFELQENFERLLRRPR